jgi:hypothetical protein
MVNSTKPFLRQARRRTQKLVIRCIIVARARNIFRQNGEEEKERGRMRGVSTGFDENLYFQVISVSVRYRGKYPQ